MQEKFSRNEECKFSDYTVPGVDESAFRNTRGKKNLQNPPETKRGYICCRGPGIRMVLDWSIATLEAKTISKFNTEPVNVGQENKDNFRHLMVKKKNLPCICS